MSGYRMVEMFFDRCVEPLISDEPIVTAGLSELDHPAVLNSTKPKPDGSLWFAPDAHVSLHAFRHKARDIKGCVVSWHSGVVGEREIHSEFVIEQFDAWADLQIEKGRFAEILQCGERANTFSRMLESRNASDRVFRVSINTKKEINFVFLVAGGAPLTDKHEPSCK